MGKRPSTVGLSKDARLEKEIEEGTVLEKPECGKCGWKGSEPCTVNAGCPECGARLEA